MSHSSYVQFIRLKRQLWMSTNLHDVLSFSNNEGNFTAGVFADLVVRLHVKAIGQKPFHFSVIRGGS